MRFETPAYSGNEFEYDLFGQVDIRDPKYLVELAKATTDKQTGYVPFRQAVDLAKKFQPGDPTNPKKDFLRELRIELVDKLGLETEKDADAVKVFTAVKTPLDAFHGADAFVTFTKNGKEILVTLDASLRKDKITGIDKSKADVLIGEMPMPEEDEDAYLQAIENVVDKIARQIELKERRPAA
ncbi:hypothetical protein HY633_02405 [Candidatus Uhrbacteria bacterium]|nr:hypothetical protein [Candidatus Uhrbacteria bacterium]